MTKQTRGFTLIELIVVINEAVRFDATTFESVAGTPFVFRVRGAGDPPNCSFTYTAATATVPAVVSAPTTTGCN